MALLLIEGFDQYDDDDEMRRGGWLGNLFTSVTPGESTIVHSTGGLSVRIPGGVWIRHGFPVSTATVVVGFAYYGSASPANAQLMNLYDGSIDQIQMQTNTGGELLIKRGNTTLLTTSGAGITFDEWQYIELKVLIHASAGTLDVVVNGVNVGSATGLDTLDSANTQVDSIEIWGHATTDPYFDDVYVLDDSGALNTDFLGECFVETVVPDADGAVNNFTASPAVSNYLNVDDLAPPDDDTSYNHSSTATDKERYAMTALTASIGDVFGVEASALVRKEDPGERLIRVLGFNSATEVESGDKGFGVTYRYVNHIFDADPNGDIAWTEAAVNTAEFGIILEA